jgi:hypothetical protein
MIEGEIHELPLDPEKERPHQVRTQSTQGQLPNLVSRLRTPLSQFVFDYNMTALVVMALARS